MWLDHSGQERHKLKQSTYIKSVPVKQDNDPKAVIKSEHRMFLHLVLKLLVFLHSTKLMYPDSSTFPAASATNNLNSFIKLAS